MRPKTEPDRPPAAESDPSGRLLEATPDAEAAGSAEVSCPGKRAAKAESSITGQRINRGIRIIAMVADRILNLGIGVKLGRFSNITDQAQVFDLMTDAFIYELRQLVNWCVCSYWVLMTITYISANCQIS